MINTKRKSNIVPIYTATQYVEQITSTWRKSVEYLLQVSNMLFELDNDKKKKIL